MPVTRGGRIFVGFYAAFGIPLNVIFLADIGFLVARLIVRILRVCKRRRHQNRRDHRPDNTICAPTRNEEMTLRKQSVAFVKGLSAPRILRRKTDHSNMTQSQGFSVYGGPKSLVSSAAERSNTISGLQRSRRTGLSMTHTMSVHGPKPLVISRDSSGTTSTLDSRHNTGNSIYPQLHTDDTKLTDKRIGGGGGESIALQDVPPLESDSTFPQSSHLSGTYDVNESTTNTESSDTTQVVFKTTDGTKQNGNPEKIPDDSAEVYIDDPMMDDEEEMAVDIEVPLPVILFILILYVLFGSGFMAAIEQWDYNEAVYFTVITLTTIGYGDIVPNNHYQDRYFMISIVYTIIGLSVMSTCIALAQRKVLRAVDRLTSWMESYAGDGG